MELEFQNSSVNIVYTDKAINDLNRHGLYSPEEVRNLKKTQRVDIAISSWTKIYNCCSREVQDLTKTIEEQKKNPDKFKIKAVMIGVATLVATAALVVLAWYALPWCVVNLLPTGYGDANAYVASAALFGGMGIAIAPFLIAGWGYCAVMTNWDPSFFEERKIRAEKKKAQSEQALASIHDLMRKKKREWSEDLRVCNCLLEQRKMAPFIAREMCSKLEEALEVLDQQIGRFRSS